MATAKAADPRRGVRRPRASSGGWLEPPKQSRARSGPPGAVLDGIRGAKLRIRSLAPGRSSGHAHATRIPVSAIFGGQHVLESLMRTCSCEAMKSLSGVDAEGTNTVSVLQFRGVGAQSLNARGAKTYYVVIDFRAPHNFFSRGNCLHDFLVFAF